MMPGAGPIRALVLNAMIDLEHPPKSISRFESCCRSTLVLLNTKTNDLKLAFETCGSRHCPHCELRYRRAIALRISDAIGRVKPRIWRFITLTMSHSDLPLSDQLNHLQASFRRLRMSQLWQSTQLKGFGIIEVTWSTSASRWHPHLHILTRGLFIPQRALSHQWIKASGGSEVVDIRKISSSAKAIAYVTKYLGKAPDLLSAENPRRLMAEYLSALRHRKMLISFGTQVVPEYEPPGDLMPLTLEPWIIVTTLTKLLKARAQGDVSASMMLDRLLHGGKAPRHSTFIRDG
ncbi:protein rep [Candidatus Sumerlaeota bacterium]|nr:protein rep [Candidatus Sumerlaeota bacterium]